MSFPKYPRYKDSHVEWLGEVPEHWNVLPIKKAFQIVGGSTPRSDIENFWNGDVLWATPADLSKLDSLYIDDTQRKITEAGLESCAATVVPENTIILSTRAPIGSLAITKVAMCTNQGCKSLVPDCETDAKYFGYLLSITSEALNVRGKGTTFLELSADELGAFLTSRPPLFEQRCVAAFLDQETAKIDALIAEQQRLIELLREKRQAIIAHAVSKGLVRVARTEASGNKWLADIPSSWNVMQLKHVCLLLKDGTHLPPAREDEGVPLLSVRNLVDGEFVKRDDDSMISESSYRELCRSFVPQEGDLLLAIVGATLGKTAIIPGGLGPFHIQRSLAVFRVRPEIIRSRFLGLIFQSIPFQSLLWELVGYSAQPGVYLGTLGGIGIPVPPLEEQRQILDWIGPRLNELATLTTEAQRSIKLLQERRSALTSAAVTGKIDIRGFAAVNAA